jgi:hypothetical protein
MNLSEFYSQFKCIWLVDFEFRQPDGFLPQPHCAVLKELKSQRTLKLWQPTASDFPEWSAEDSLFVAFNSDAEFSCLMELGARLPQHVLDLYTEFRCRNSGLVVPNGQNLLGALVYFGLPGIAATAKEENRDLAMRGGPYSTSEQLRLIEYCESDVTALENLLPAMLPGIDLPYALIRGEYMKSAARMQRTGVPLDTNRLELLRGRWIAIQHNLIDRVDADYGVYEDATFTMSRFEKYLSTNQIPWPLTPTGRLSLDADTFKDLARVFPQLEPLKELRATLGQTRLVGLTIGDDGRNRCWLNPFGSKTGRNQPSTTKFIFGPATWMRYLIVAPRGLALAYIDFAQEEFGIAAFLSGDEAMMQAYLSGDPYLLFAKQVGLVPTDGTKHSHRVQRDLCKTIILAVQYGMGEGALSVRLGVSLSSARELLDLHHRAYPKYWSWSDAVQDYAMLHSKLHTTYGWEVQIGRDANPRSLRNFPSQANGAEILRLSCILAHREGIEICAPVHDALLIQSRANAIEEAAEICRAAMAGASQLVLPGFPLRTDAKIIRHPGRFTDPRGTRIWKEIWEMPMFANLTNTNDCFADETQLFHQRAPVPSNIYV